MLAVVSQRISCGCMDTDNVPTVGSILPLVAMENNVTRIANNYITRHNTRRSRSKGRWVWIGSVIAVIGLLSFYGATKAKSSSLPSAMSCDEIKSSMERDLFLYEFNQREAKKDNNETYFGYADNFLKRAGQWASIYTAKCK